MSVKEFREKLEDMGFPPEPLLDMIRRAYAAGVFNPDSLMYGKRYSIIEDRRLMMNVLSDFGIITSVGDGKDELYRLTNRGFRLGLVLFISRLKKVADRLSRTLEMYPKGVVRAVALSRVEYCDVLNIRTDRSAADEFLRELLEELLLEGYEPDIGEYWKHWLYIPVEPQDYRRLLLQLHKDIVESVKCAEEHKKNLNEESGEARDAIEFFIERVQSPEIAEYLKNLAKGWGWRCEGGRTSLYDILVARLMVNYGGMVHALALKLMEDLVELGLAERVVSPDDEGRPRVVGYRAPPEIVYLLGLYSSDYSFRPVYKHVLTAYLLLMLVMPYREVEGLESAYTVATKYLGMTEDDYEEIVGGLYERGVTSRRSRKGGFILIDEVGAWVEADRVVREADAILAGYPALSELA